ncbi:MAG: hypothetical protein KGZ97_10770 [Bacteroidetes bacterium]|nr:hypothetical protein [Bacteroidota bacterium]
MKPLIFSFLLIVSSVIAFSQAIPEHISNKALYDFIDELANEHIIDISSEAKPYSREYIATKLNAAFQKKDKLTQRQIHILDKYLNEFAIELNIERESDVTIYRKDSTFLFSLFQPTLDYRDSLFRFSLRPIYGVQFYSNNNGQIRHTWGGAEVNSYIGKSWSVYASIRDNQQKGGRLSSPTYFTQSQGGVYKGVTGGGAGGEFSEMRGGIAASWNWGAVYFEKNHLMWGDNYNGANIFSGQSPSFPMLRLNLKPAKWLDFHYYHGWLNSMVVDSSRTYFPYDGSLEKSVYYNKYIAANIYTLSLLPRLNISVGNSVIYDNDNVYAGYLIPFFFYKSVVHTQTSGLKHNHNSAMFFNVSSRQIKHLHVYGSFFIDEFSKTRIGDDERNNFTSTKAGARLSNWPVKNVSLTGEYTYTYPMTYQHRTPTTTFESNKYNLGHYLRSNARELFLAINIQPYRGLILEVSYSKAENGNEYPYLYGIGRVDDKPFMKDITWSNETTAVKAKYLIYNNFSIFADVYFMNIHGYDVDGITAQQYLDMFSPKLFHGKSTTVSFGMQLGF